MLQAEKIEIISGSTTINLKICLQELPDMNLLLICWLTVSAITMPKYGMWGTFKDERLEMGNSMGKY